MHRRNTDITFLETQLRPNTAKYRTAPLQTQLQGQGRYTSASTPPTNPSTSQPTVFSFGGKTGWGPTPAPTSIPNFVLAQSGGREREPPSQSKTVPLSESANSQGERDQRHQPEQRPVQRPSDPSDIRDQARAVMQCGNHRFQSYKRPILCDSE
jgi:hypothetical protein